VEARVQKCWRLVSSAGTTHGRGGEFVNDRETHPAYETTLTLLALGVYSAKVGTGVAGRYIEAHESKPSLVRTTKRSVLQVI
jgi:ATPase family AAA domain-containing protein 3A/B